MESPTDSLLDIEVDTKEIPDFLMLFTRDTEAETAEYSINQLKELLEKCKKEDIR